MKWKNPTDKRLFVAISQGNKTEALDPSDLEAQGRKPPEPGDTLILPNGQILAIWAKHSPTPHRLGNVKIDPRSYRAADVKNFEGPLLPRLIRKGLIGQDTLKKKDKILLAIVGAVGGGILLFMLIIAQRLGVL